ncbi:hypothetical protein COLO4_33395 [Corchorus olitorius]|uniref:Uncharacterized protein n=1 Tax=Corchorus olitorius TaxID=93759 RepID=A0A1R3GU28_9ROSI|nr:hypothetical protein COLO4_33395 [Corchorus olitorius]
MGDWVKILGIPEKSVELREDDPRITPERMRIALYKKDRELAQNCLKKSPQVITVFL